MWRTLRFLWYKIDVKVFEEASKYGISQLPRVSKLRISRFGKDLYNYDRGLDFNVIPKKMLNLIFNYLNDIL